MTITALWVAVIVALIAGIASVAVAVINGYSAKKIAEDARFAREAAERVEAKTDKVIHLVDGTQSKILETNTAQVAELRELGKQLANLDGQLKGRDWMQKKMENRADALATPATLRALPAPAEPPAKSE